jgi:putative redox protein
MRDNNRFPASGGRMKARVKWIEGVSFAAESGSGHAIVTDGSPDAGGRNVGVRPMELVLMGAASCTAFDLVTILKKARQPILDCAVEAVAERAETVPRVFTKIHLNYRVAARDLDPKQVERAVQLSKDKYCSATLMLGKTAAITYDIEIVDADRLPIPATEVPAT